MLMYCTSFLPIACSHSLAIHHVLTRHFPPMCARTLSLLHTHVSHTRINRDGGFPVAKDDGYNVGPTGGGTVQMGNLKVV